MGSCTKAALSAFFLSQRSKLCRNRLRQPKNQSLLLVGLQHSVSALLLQLLADPSVLHAASKLVLQICGATRDGTQDALIYPTQTNADIELSRASRTATAETRLKPRIVDLGQSIAHFTHDAPPELRFMRQIARGPPTPDVPAMQDALLR